MFFFFHFDLWLSTLTHSVTHRRIRFSVLLYSHPKPMATNARKKSTRNERKNNGIEQRVRVKMKKKKKMVARFEFKVWLIFCSIVLYVCIKCSIKCIGTIRMDKIPNANRREREEKCLLKCVLNGDGYIVSDCSLVLCTEWNVCGCDFVCNSKEETCYRNTAAFECVVGSSFVFIQFPLLIRFFPSFPR